MDTLTIRNPELETLRNEILESKQDNEKCAKELASHLSSIHAGYLFCACGKAALAQICVVISSTPAASMATQTSSWKDLASLLGLNFHQICCIENQRCSNTDCTENVIKWYAQNRDATIDRIVTALYELKRFDAIIMARPYLLALEKYARKEQIKRTDEEDFGYHSVDGLETEEPTDDGILRPTGLRHLKSQLQITLRNLETHEKEESSYETVQKVEENLQRASVIYRPPPQRKCSKRVMLTFASDGENIASNIANEFRSKEDHLPIGVLILDEHVDLVEANAEQFITHYFPKMDFIIPIITPKYLDSIEKNSSREENYFCSIDTRYVQMIHTLMVKYYVENSCRNDKFRSVIPDNYVADVVKDHRMKRDLVLQAFVLESEINTLAWRILKKKKPRK